MLCRQWYRKIQLPCAKNLWRNIIGPSHGGDVCPTTRTRTTNGGFHNGHKEMGPRTSRPLTKTSQPRQCHPNTSGMILSGSVRGSTIRNKRSRCGKVSTRRNGRARLSRSGKVNRNGRAEIRGCGRRKKPKRGLVLNNSDTVLPVINGRDRLVSSTTQTSSIMTRIILTHGRARKCPVVDRRPNLRISSGGSGPSSASL